MCFSSAMEFLCTLSIAYGFIVYGLQFSKYFIILLEIEIRLKRQLLTGSLIF